MKEGVPETKIEQGPIPEKLYRAFVVSGEDLSPEMFDSALIMGQKNEGDSTKTSDGNEAGVYMSTNATMVESAGYANRSHGFVEVPRYAGKYGFENSVPLPGCGVVVEVDTEGLHVRKPGISTVMQGHYNNGFEGEEWIADEIPADRYHAIKFILSVAPNDRNKVVFEIDRNDPESLVNTIEKVKEYSVKKRKEAETFKAFLENLTDKERANQVLVERRWNAVRSNSV